MKENPSDNIIAKPTGEVLQDPEMIEQFCPAKNQLYFKLKDPIHEFSIGLRDLLECLSFAEKCGEIPPLSEDWWRTIYTRYELWPELEVED